MRRKRSALRSGTIHEANLRQQLDSANDSLEKSFAGVMLQYEPGVLHRSKIFIVTGLKHGDQLRRSGIFFAHRCARAESDSAAPERRKTLLTSLANAAAQLSPNPT
jgi:hypothetical protein